ncbi:MAG: ribosomal protein S18-alanine N-acetyltransferase [Gemmatimonadales bacterium]
MRPAQAADVPHVAAIERAAFADPWSPNDFAECVAANVPFLVALDHDRLTGYIVAHHAGDEGEILNLGVAPGDRRRGIGRALVEEMLAALRSRAVRVVYLEARESNAAARRLYARLGFAEVGRRAKYYRRPVEDAVILRAAIPAVGVSAKL